MKILLVDDKASVRTAMVNILLSLGFDDVTHAVDGEDAWEKLKQTMYGKTVQPFELVISDLEMPKMSGMELLRAVRLEPETRHTPFIMATTVTEKEVIIETMRLGVQAYIIKPFDRQTVEFKLKQAGVL
ncbi:MAG: response regulator [Desulfobacterales bacterium]|nr:response regulator [Desulfobacterales bacterium]